VDACIRARGCETPGSVRQAKGRTIVVAAAKPNTCCKGPIRSVRTAKNPDRSYNARARQLVSMTSNRIEA